MWSGRQKDKASVVKGRRKSSRPIRQQDLWKDVRSVLVSVLKNTENVAVEDQCELSPRTNGSQPELGANSLQSTEIPVEPPLSVRPSAKGTRRDWRWSLRRNQLHLELLCHTSSTLHHCPAALTHALIHSQILLCHSRRPRTILQFVSWHSVTFSNCRSIKEIPSASLHWSQHPRHKHRLWHETSTNAHFRYRFSIFFLRPFLC